MLTEEDKRVIADSETIINDIQKVGAEIRKTLQILHNKVKHLASFEIDGYLFEQKGYSSSSWCKWQMRKKYKYHYDKAIVLFDIDGNDYVHILDSGYDIVELLQFKDSVIKYLKGKTEEKRQELDREENLIEAFTGKTREERETKETSKVIIQPWSY